MTDAYPTRSWPPAAGRGLQGTQFAYLDHVHLYAMKTLRKLFTRHGLGAVEFVHLKPIQTVAGNPNPVLRMAKNLWHYGAWAVYRVTEGRCNLNNLFAVARRGCDKGPLR